MTREDTAQKIREHLGKTKSSALMMAHAQSAIDRARYLRDLSAELKKAVALVEKLGKE